MDFCLRSRVAPRYLKQAAEIRVDYRDRRSIPDLAHTYPNKTIILFPPENNEEYDWKELEQYNLLCKSNFIINLNSVNYVPTVKEYGFRFMINVEATSYWELDGLQDLGAEYAYVGIPLFFDLQNTLNYDIKLRAIPTVAYNHNLPRRDGIFGQWIRPEDVDKYEDFIQVLEFEPCDITREQMLFKIYAIDKQWRTRLDVLVEDLGSPAVNRMIEPTLILARLTCRQRCKSGGRCHMCYTVLQLANPEKLPKPIKQPIEK